MADWKSCIRSYFSQCGHIGIFFLRPLWTGELLHGVVEGVAADAHEEVDGIAGLAGFGAVPIMVFDYDFTAPLVGDGVVVIGAGFEPVPEFFEYRQERDLAGGADFRAVPGHGLFSSGAASARG